MTTANQITIARILLIPVFIVFAVLYSQSIRNGSEETWLRIAALGAFALSALGDALDGYIARTFNQSTPLGAILDPVADKLLLVSAIVVLSALNWRPSLPIWFAFMAILRDVIITAWVLLIRYKVGHVRIRPLLSSKICTFLQLSCVCWVLLDFWSVDARPLPLNSLIAAAALFTLISGVQYIFDGIEQLRKAPHPQPE